MFYKIYLNHENKQKSTIFSLLIIFLSLKNHNVILLFDNVLLYSMVKTKSEAKSPKNKNNKKKPENLMKKEYLESLEELKKSIAKN